MADAADLKSAGGDSMRVRLSPALYIVVCGQYPTTYRGWLNDQYQKQTEGDLRETHRRAGPVDNMTR